MTIKSLQIKSRIKNLAASRSTEVAVADFRSLSEVKEFLDVIKPALVKYEEGLKSLKTLFLKMNIKDRINKKKPEELAASSSFVFDASKPQPKVTDKYGDGKIDPRILRVVDPGTVSDDKKLKVTILPHDYKALRKNFMGVEEWENKLHSLSVIMALLHTDFKGTPGAGEQLKQAREMEKRIRQANAKAYAFLEKEAKKYAPEYFSSIVEAIIEKLEDKYQDKYFDELEVTTYLTADEIKPAETVPTKTYVKNRAGERVKKIVDKEIPAKYNLKFVTYVKLKNLQNELGDIAPEVYLVYIASVDMETSMMTMFVTFSNRFVSPLKVLYGRRLFHNEDMCWKQTLAILVSQFGLKKIVQTPWPQTPQKLSESVKGTHYGKYVSDCTLNSDEELVVTFNDSISKEGEAEVIGDKIRQEVQVALTALVKKRVPTQFRVEQPERGTWQAIISLNPDIGYIRDERAERSMFDKLRRMGIPLTEDEIRSFIRRKNF